MKSKHFFRIIFYAMFLFVLAYCTDGDPVQYSLTIEAIPVEGGTVTPISGMYNEGKEITLTALPSKEYIFKKWVVTRDPNLTPNTVSSLQNPFLIMMNSDKTITAEFEKVNYSLTINIEGGGTVTQELILGKSTNRYPSGSQVKLTAIPEQGYKFSSWGGDLESIINPLVINCDKPMTINAVFIPESNEKTYIPDYYFEKALKELGYDDILDNYVFNYKIRYIENLDISGKQIKDLSGIEGFLGLRNLWCNNNKLSFANLSKNTKLDILDLSDNVLVSVDLSDNLELDFLDLSNNQLTSLDISNLGIFWWYINVRNNKFNCLQVNQDQINYLSLPNVLNTTYEMDGWKVDEEVTFSLNCN